MHIPENGEIARPGRIARHDPSIIVGVTHIRDPIQRRYSSDRVRYRHKTNLDARTAGAPPVSRSISASTTFLYTLPWMLSHSIFLHHISIPRQNHDFGSVMLVSSAEYLIPPVEFMNIFGTLGILDLPLSWLKGNYVFFFGTTKRHLL